MTTSDINSGTAQGLMEFLDYLVDKGYGAQSAVGPWKSASKRVLVAMEGDGYLATDVTKFDPDEYLDRFSTRERGNYKAESLRSYRSRFRNAITSYRDFLGDGSIPSFRASPGAASSKPVAKKEAPARVTPHSRQPEESQQRMVDYPFPLQSGDLALIRLPARLAKNDAERLATFVRTLVFEPVKELSSGDDAKATPGADDGGS